MSAPRIEIPVIDKETVKVRIRSAFAHVRCPLVQNLVSSWQGDEPELVVEAFKDKKDWRTLTLEFLIQAPEDTDASPLHFFSAEAFHFYFPAYLIADIDFDLTKSDPVFHLTHGLTEESKNDHLGPGERTWWDFAVYKFSIFNKEEALAIVAYLEFKMENGDSPDKPRIREALENYWYERAGKKIGHKAADRA